MFHFTLSRRPAGISVLGLLCMFFLLMFHNQQTFGQTFANSQTNAVNGLCLFCSVVNPNNAVNGNVTDYSTFNITAGLLGVSVEQTLIFPSATTSNGCDSLFIGVGSANLPIDLTLFQAVTVQTFNGTTAHTPVVLSSSILEIRILAGAPVVVARLKPSQNFDRVKVTLSSQLLGLLNSFRVYFASHQSAAPAAPVLSNPFQQVCIGQSTSFDIVSPANATFHWYTSPTGGTSFHTGSTYTTPVWADTGTYFYYPESISTLNGCASTSRGEAIAEVHEYPDIPTVSPADTTICPGSSVTFHITEPSGPFFWYDTPDSDSVIHIGNSFSSGTLTNDTTFYVETNNLVCASDRIPLVVTVRPLAAPDVTPSSTTICAGKSATLSASVGGGSIHWYTVASGGTPVHTGNSFTTPLLFSSITYYAQAQVGDCYSDTRTPVTVTVNSTPVAPTVTPADTTVCSGTTATFNVTSPAGTVRWYLVPTGGVSLYTGTPYTTPSITSNVSFYVDVTQGSCTGPRTRVPVTVISCP